MPTACNDSCRFKGFPVKHQPLVYTATSSNAIYFVGLPCSVQSIKDFLVETKGNPDCEPTESDISHAPTPFQVMSPDIVASLAQFVAAHIDPKNGASM